MPDTQGMSSHLFRIGASFLLVVAALALSGCGSTVDEQLVKTAGVHGNALEKVYVIYSQDVLKSASSRDLKDVDAALQDKDPNKATEGDLRRAQGEIDSRIEKLDAYKDRLGAATRKLRTTPAPDFAASLDETSDSDEFAAAYKKTTSTTQRMGTAAVGTISVATSALEKYLDFLEAWEGYLDNGETGSFVSSANASDKAFNRLKRKINVIEAKGTLTEQLDPSVDVMVKAAGNDDQIAQLITELREQYPKSFLPVHIVEK